MRIASTAFRIALSALRTAFETEKNTKIRKEDLSDGIENLKAHEQHSCPAQSHRVAGKTRDHEISVGEAVQTDFSVWLIMQFDFV